jgi:hypothetical protein
MTGAGPGVPEQQHVLAGVSGRDVPVPQQEPVDFDAGVLSLMVLLFF